MAARPATSATTPVGIASGAGGGRSGRLSESLYLYYRMKLSLWITRAEDQVGLDHVPDWAPHTFGLAAGAPAPHVLRISLDQAGTRAEVSRTWFDHTVARYVARLK